MAKLVDLDGLKYFYSKIKAMLALKADDSAVVKSVNGTTPDTSGNVSVTVGGVSTDTANTWTAAQTFGDIVFGGLEKCDWEALASDSVKPTKSRALLLKSASSGVLTIDMSELAKQTSDNWRNAIPFKFIIMCPSGAPTLKIDGITYLYTNNVTITEYMILEGFVFGGTSMPYGYISATSLSINVEGSIS